jgi:hypothetical protein
VFVSRPLPPLHAALSRVQPLICRMDRRSGG